jgi:hypothetical protein
VKQRTPGAGSEHEESGNPREPGDASFPGMDAFAKMWSDFAAKMAAAGVAFTPGAAPPDASRQVRAAMFKAMGEACDEFMRSPQFQEMMKQSLNNSIQFRKQLNDFLGRMQHEFQGTSRQDVDSLMQVMEHVERRVTDSFERLSERLDELNERLERVEKPKPARKKTSRTRRGAKR